MCCFDFLSLFSCNGGCCQKNYCNCCNRCNGCNNGCNRCCCTDEAYRAGSRQGYRYGAEIAERVLSTDHSCGTPWHNCCAAAKAYNGGFSCGFRNGVNAVLSGSKNCGNRSGGSAASSAPCASNAYGVSEAGNNAESNAWYARLYGQGAAQNRDCGCTHND